MGVCFHVFCVTMVGYSINYFLPIILLGMGMSTALLISLQLTLLLDFSVAEAQCLTTPPWIFIALLMFAQARVSDRYQLRAPIIAMNTIIALIGLALIGFHSSNPVRYFGVFLVIADASGNTPPVLTYQDNNISEHWKRAFCSATLVGSGDIGGIAGALVFRSQDQPRYLLDAYVAIAANLCILLCTCGMSLWFWYCNKMVRKGIWCWIITKGSFIPFENRFMLYVNGAGDGDVQRSVWKRKFKRKAGFRW